MVNFVIDSVQTTLLELIPEETLYGKKILVGLSGGADSVCLLICLHTLSEKHGFSVSACHINHMIRGDEADRDEDFSRQLCQRLGIVFYAEKFDVPKIAVDTKKGLEETARDVRYSYFEELCDSGVADYIATAHNAWDNSETVLLNITRGCGLSGLCGIPLKRGRIIRPLINVSREDIETFLMSINQDYVKDSTNLINDCSRNIIRLNIIPELCKINPSLHRQVSKLSKIASRENDYLEKMARENATDSISELAKLDRVILSRVIGGMYRNKTGNLPGMNHIDILCDEIYKASKDNCGEQKTFNLPGKISFKFQCGKLIIEAENEDFSGNYCEYDIEALYGINSLCNGKFLAVVTKKEDDDKKKCDSLEYNQNIYSLFMESQLFSDIIKGKIRLRSGLSGDKIRICGMSKDIRKMYSAKKIPLDHRKYLPRIVDGETGEILALPYVGVCDSQNEHTDLSDISVKLYILAARSNFTDDEQEKQ
ncbi:MAG: tRNA lysidine(34) synthetase TilS [Clostridia bacterium]|nr:tRNA lysidine(34) synthetase TilS [Clostridia bacterium]